MWNKNKILITILSSVLLLQFINVIPVNAVGGLYIQDGQNTCSSCNSRSITFVGNPHINDALIVIAYCGCSIASVWNTPTDTSNTYTGQFCATYSAGNEVACEWYTNSTSNGSDTVVLTTAGGTNRNYQMFIFDARSVYLNNVCQAGGSSASNTAITTSTTCSWSTMGVAISFAICGSGCSLGSGFSGGSANCLVSASEKCQHADSSQSITNPTNFPWSQSPASNFLDLGINIPGNSANITQPLSICTQQIGSVPLGITIPLYDPPGFNSDWTTIENDATSNPSIKFTVIVNVANGAGSAQSPTFTTGINAMLAAGVRVIGYEYTTYSHRASSLVQTDIQHWTAFYPQINGIFFDQVGSTAGNASYYTSLVAFASTQHYTSFYSSGNPGIAVSPSLYGIFTNLNIWEKPGTPSTTVLASSTISPPSAFSFISNGISTGADTNSTYLNTVTPYVGNVFITSSNAYTALPSYFSTLVSNVALTASGVPSGTFTLSGTSNPSPGTLASQSKGSCTFTNITAGASLTLTVTVPADTTYTRFRMNSSSTSSTTQNITTCASGTCTGKTVDVYYQVANSYGVQAVNPTKFNGNSAVVIIGFNAGTAVTQNIPITLGSNLDTIGYTFFDFGTISFPTFFTINGLQWAASPQSSASVLNMNSGGSQLIVGYIGGNQSSGSGTITRTVIVSLITTVTFGGTTCGNINDCSANQFGSFLSFLLPALILIGMFEYLVYRMGILDERAYVLVFMIIVSGICYASSLQAFGNFGIPWYIGIFVDIVGFMLIITYQRDRGITSE